MCYVVKFRLANGEKAEMIGDNIRELMDALREHTEERHSPVVDLDIEVKRDELLNVGEN